MIRHLGVLRIVLYSQFALLLWSGTPLGSTRALAESDDELGQEVDLSNPPAHLRGSAVIQILQSRRVLQLPKTIQSFLQQLIYADVSPARVLVPRGRSAQVSATDERNPRLVAGAHSSTKIAGRYALGFEDYSALPGSDWEGRVLVGFAKATGKGEAISWNRDARPQRFDYFVMTGMRSGETPRLYEVTQRENCTKCHQNQAAIFSLPPWSEAINHDPAIGTRGARAARFTADPIVFEQDGALLTREPTPVANNGGLAMDTSSSVSNHLIQASRVLATVCRNDLNCRRKILIAAMANPAQAVYLRKVVVATGTTGDDTKDLDFVVAPLNPLKQILVPDGTNQTRIPRNLTNFQQELVNRWPADNFANVSHLLVDSSSALNGTATQQAFDPLTRRGPLVPVPTDVALPFVFDAAFETLGLTLEDANRLQTLSLNERMSKLLPVGEMDQELRNLVVNWPPTRAEILAFYKIRDHVVEEMAAAAPVTDQAAESPIGHFGKYCVGCHSDPQGATAPFIPFRDAAQLRLFNANNGGVVVSRLGKQDMPPNNVTDASRRPTGLQYQAMAQFFSANNATVLSGRVGPLRTSHLGIRYQNVDAIRNSYIVPPGISIVQEGVTEDCGGGVEEGPGSYLGSLRAGLGSDGKVYVALENFPHYMLGNIIQVTSFADFNNRRCYVYGVSRNGKLLSVARNLNRQVLGTVTYQATTSSPQNIALAHISGNPGEMYAAGKDGKLYRLKIVNDRSLTYELTEVVVDNVPTNKWSKIDPNGDNTAGSWIGATIEGSTVVLRPLRGDGLRLRSDITQDRNQPAPRPNLLDRTALTLNPGSYLGE